MLLRLSVLALGGIAVIGLAACSSRTYPTNRPDKAYNLAAMALTPSDLPAGIAPAVLSQHAYDNSQWVSTLRGANLLDTSTSAADQTKQFDNEGRIDNWVSIYQPSSLQRIIGVTTVSTLFKTAQQADTAMSKELCGLPVSPSVQTAPLAVPKLADDSLGFQTVGQGGLVDSTLCFRTGRIIHAIQETNVPGTEDFAALVQMGENMVTRINGVLDGKIKGTAVPTAPPQTPSATPSGTPTVPPTTAPGASTTPVASATATP